LQTFDKYLVDADWSVCAGNWMWVSSSAFEKVLQCPRCICPVRYGQRMDPKGDYVRYVCGFFLFFLGTFAKIKPMFPSEFWFVNPVLNGTLGNQEMQQENNLLCVLKSYLKTNC
jgi:hypothetical protein